MLLVTRSTVMKRSVLAELHHCVSKSQAPVLGFIVTAAESDLGYGGTYGYGYGYENRPPERHDHAAPSVPAQSPVHPDAGPV
jgi:hypothetical protein